MVKVQWVGASDRRHLATFSKSGLSPQIRVQVETFSDTDGSTPERVEWGTLDSLLPSLMRPQGKYGLLYPTLRLCSEFNSESEEIFHLVCQQARRLQPLKVVRPDSGSGGDVFQRQEAARYLMGASK